MTMVKSGEVYYSSGLHVRGCFLLG